MKVRIYPSGIPLANLATVNYCWLQLQLTTAGSSALKFCSSIVILCVSVEKLKKKSRLTRNATKLCTS